MRVLIFADQEPVHGVLPALRLLYDVSMVERHIRNFAFLGVTNITVVVPANEYGKEIRRQCDGFDTTWFAGAYPIHMVDTDSFASALQVDSDHPLLMIDAHHLYDQRALDAIIQARPDTMLVDIDATPGNKTTEPCHLAIVGAAFSARLAEFWQGSCALWEHLTSLRKNGEIGGLNIRDIDSYVINLRRFITPFWLPVETARDEWAGERHLIDAAQKGTLDLPARYLHPLCENWMTKQAARFPAISPNVITTLTNIIAFLATGLMAFGDLGQGLVLAVLVGILDGVDGKLARTTVRCTKFGDRYEHILDNIYELSWYWALGWAFSGGALGHFPLILSGVMTLFHILDRAFTGGFKHFKQIELFDYAPIDRLFRQIGSRRNINILMMIIGTAIRLPYEAFMVMVAWMMFTAVFHGARAVWIALLSSRSDRMTETVGGARS